MKLATCAWFNLASSGTDHSAAAAIQRLEFTALFESIAGLLLTCGMPTLDISLDTEVPEMLCSGLM